MRARLGVLLVPVMAVTIAAHAPQTPRPTFEVASVKRNVSGRAGGAIQIPPTGTITFTNIMLRVVIRMAYQVDAYAEESRLIPGPYARIIGTPTGGPQPDVPRWDIQGKPPENTPGPERRAMMRALLEDRFKLRVHWETRDMPVYVLTVARPGRLGPNLKPSKFDCEAYLAQRRNGGTAPEPVDANGESWCLPFVDTSRPGVVYPRFAGPIRVLAERLQTYVDRPIIDATGLSATFEWKMTVGFGANAPDDVPQIFTALQEQLGLKLEARQAPVEVLVIDSVELPAPD